MAGRPSADEDSEQPQSFQDLHDELDSFADSSPYRGPPQKRKGSEGSAKVKVPHKKSRVSLTAAEGMQPGAYMTLFSRNVLLT